MSHCAEVMGRRSYLSNFVLKEVWWCQWVDASYCDSQPGLSRKRILLTPPVFHAVSVAQFLVINVKLATASGTLYLHTAGSNEAARLTEDIIKFLRVETLLP